MSLEKKLTSLTAEAKLVEAANWQLNEKVATLEAENAHLRAELARAKPVSATLRRWWTWWATIWRDGV